MSVWMKSAETRWSSSVNSTGPLKCLVTSKWSKIWFTCNTSNRSFLNCKAVKYILTWHRCVCESDWIIKEEYCALNCHKLSAFQRLCKRSCHWLLTENIRRWKWVIILLQLLKVKLKKKRFTARIQIKTLDKEVIMVNNMECHARIGYAVLI